MDVGLSEVSMVIAWVDQDKLSKGANIRPRWTLYCARQEVGGWIGLMCGLQGMFFAVGMQQLRLWAAGDMCTTLCLVASTWKSAGMEFGVELFMLPPWTVCSFVRDPTPMNTGLCTMFWERDLDGYRLMR